MEIGKDYTVKYTRRQNGLTSYQTSIFTCIKENNVLILKEKNGIRKLLVSELKSLKGIWDIMD